MNITQLEKSLMEMINYDVSDSIRRSIREKAEEIIQQETAKAIKRVHLTMTREEIGDHVNLKYSIDLRRDKDDPTPKK